MLIRRMLVPVTLLLSPSAWSLTNATERALDFCATATEQTISATFDGRQIPNVESPLRTRDTDFWLSRLGVSRQDLVVQDESSSSTSIGQTLTDLAPGTYRVVLQGSIPAAAQFVFQMECQFLRQAEDRRNHLGYQIWDKITFLAPQRWGGGTIETSVQHHTNRVLALKDGDLGPLVPYLYKELFYRKSASDTIEELARSTIWRRGPVWEQATPAHLSSTEIQMNGQSSTGIPYVIVEVAKIN